MNIEKQLLEKYIKAKKLTEEAKLVYEAHKSALEFCLGRLVEYMEDADVTSTAKYDGLGHVTMSKPRLYASFNKSDQEAVFGFLAAHGMSDIIKPTVNASSLSSVVGDLINSGVEIPSEINCFMKPQLRTYIKK